MKIRNKTNVIVSCLVTLLFSMPLVRAENITKDKPNIIIVITDDQGMGDLSCLGNPVIKTPHLDNFYSDAVRFTNFHVSTTCAPTRGALMAGRHTNRLNVFHTIAGRSLLFEDELILPQIFAQNGYATGMFGKWHLGDNYPFRPEDRGFQEVVRHGGGASPRVRTFGETIILMTLIGIMAKLKNIQATVPMCSFQRQ